MSMKYKEIDILLHYHEQYLALAKQAEIQLGHLNNILIPVCTAATAFVVQQKFSQSVILIGVIIMVIGLYGLLSTTKFLRAYQKQYKRSEICSDLISKYSKKINIRKISNEGENCVLEKYKLVSKISTLRMYQSIYVIIMLIGFTATLLSSLQ